MRHLILIIIISAIGLACRKERCIEQLNPNCICTLQYDPVCGCNGKTYGNACEAECHGITDYKKGECS